MSKSNEKSNVKQQSIRNARLCFSLIKSRKKLYIQINSNFVIFRLLRFSTIESLHSTEDTLTLNR
jgi:hypothetical protein